MVQPVSPILILIGLGIRLYSRQSITYGSTRPPFIHLRSCALRVLYLFLLFILPSRLVASTSCPRQSSFFVLGPLGCAVYPMLTVGLTCTQLSRPLFSGCATYPMLVVGVTCTLSSRSFLLVRPVTSRPSSMFRSPSLSCFCNSSSPVIIPCQSATVRLRLRQCLHGIAIVFSLFHLRIPVVVRSPDLWLLSGFSVFSLVSVSVLCSVSRPCFSASSLPAQPGFLSASPFIPISAFLSSLSISGVLAAQPASSFLASVYSTVVPLSTAPFTSIDSRFPLSIAASTVLQSLCD